MDSGRPSVVQAQVLTFNASRRVLKLRADYRTPLYDTIAEVVEYEAYQVQPLKWQANREHHIMDIGANVGVSAHVGIDGANQLICGMGESRVSDRGESAVALVADHLHRKLEAISTVPSMEPLSLKLTTYIACFNAEASLEASIRSLTQSRPPDEILIIGAQRTQLQRFPRSQYALGEAITFTVCGRLIGLRHCRGRAASGFRDLGRSRSGPSDNRTGRFRRSARRAIPGFGR
jgi:hypothetical protein